MAAPTHILDTKSSARYLKARTVSIPEDFMSRVEPGDTVKINIKTGFNSKIELIEDGYALRSKLTHHTKDGKGFYVYKY